MCYINNICFVCLSDKEKLNSVHHTGTNNEIFIQVKYALPELAMLDSEIPVYICSSCHPTLLSFYMFKKKCLENYSHLKRTLRGNNASEDQSVSRLQIRANHLDQPVSEEEKQHFELTIKDEHKEPLRPSDETDKQIFNELEMNIDDNKQLIMHKPEMHIVSNIRDKNKDVSLSPEDQIDLSNIVEVNIDVKDESLEFEDYECSFCKMKFSRNTDLKTHIKVHLGIKGYECSVCKKNFARNSTLKMHMKIHLGTKDYECSICKKRFIQSGGLKTHMKYHLGIKDYECSICNKKFIQSSDLNIHMKIHAGIKNFECSTCKKKFLRSGHLKRHLKLH